MRTPAAPSAERFPEAAEVDLHIPALCEIEVCSVIRRSLTRSLTSQERAGQALEDYLHLPLTRHGHVALLDTILGLRDNFSAYDAAYVALAECLSAELLTGDEALCRAVREHLPHLRVCPLETRA